MGGRETKIVGSEGFWTPNNLLEHPQSHEKLAESGLMLALAGQGSQHSGMGKDIVRNSPAAWRVFDAADQIVGFKLSDICFDDQAGLLRNTRIGQLAICANAVATWEAMVEEFPWFIKKGTRPKAGIGVSAGQYPLLAIGRVISFRDLLTIVDKRGRAMEEAAENNPGTMWTVMYGDQAKVEEICKELEVYEAIRYPGTTVIAGRKARMVSAERAFEGLPGARILKQDIPYAFHTPDMEEVEYKTAEDLEQIDRDDPWLALIDGVTGEALTSGDEVIAQTPAHATNTIDVTKAFATGLYIANNIVEVGSNALQSYLTKLGRRPKDVLKPHGIEDKDIHITSQAVYDWGSLQSAGQHLQAA